MRCKTLSIGLRTILAIFSVALFVTSAWAAHETVLHSFGRGTDGVQPVGGVIFDTAGNLYGTTTGGGIHGYGTVFELTPRESGGWSEEVLHSFNGADGSVPGAGLTLDSLGNLYSTTLLGGIHFGVGAVFEMSPRDGGDWTEKVIHSFNDNGTDGYLVYAGLIQDAAGNLYGTTYDGGIHGFGTVFELSPRMGGGWTEKVLHSFQRYGTDGANPEANLILDPNGNLYGTTYEGGIHDFGTVFELTPRGDGDWTEKVLRSFSRYGGHGNTPTAGLILDAAGNLYGTSLTGGIHLYGTVFELIPGEDGTWTDKVLHSFGHSDDGAFPSANLIFDAAGNLYGTTENGGTANGGTVFELERNAEGGWTEKVLHNFGYGTDGRSPTAGLIFDAAGNLYGTTESGGIHGAGTVFEITP